MGIEAYSNRNLQFMSRTPPTPTFYASVISSYRGQPLLQRENSIYGKFEKSFDKEKDTTYVIPKFLEAFIRNFISEKMNIGDTTDDVISCFEEGSTTSSSQQLEAAMT